MKKITLMKNQLQCNRTIKGLLSFSALLLMSSQVTLGQVSKQAIGSFPSMDGGFEGITPVGVTGNPVSNTPRTSWGKGSATVADNTTIVRSGLHALNFSTGSSTHFTTSPTADKSAILASTSYVVQYYAWKQDVLNARTINAAAAPDASFGTNVGVTVGANGVASTTWQKVALVVTSGTGALNFGSFRIAGSGSSGVNLSIDDFVAYEGTSVDITAPDAASSVVALASGGASDVSWTAPVTGVDGGGYVVVRYASLPNADNDPNQNGIYAVGNTITNGTGALVGTVVYTGTATSFTDPVALAGSYYKVYTVDKAFNYSDEVQETLGVDDLSVDAKAVKVYANGNQVFVSNVKSNTTVSVYSVNGALVKTVETSSDTSFDLASGVWIAKVKSAEGEKAVKLLVK